MNKGILSIIGGVVLAGVGYGIWKYLDKKEQEADKELEETIEKVNKENPGLNIGSDNNDFLDKMMEEQEEAEKATENWDKRNEEIQKELSEKKSLKDQDMFEDKVSESSEFAAINALREAAGKEPMKMNENLEKFLGKDSSDNKSIKESLDNIAENIKKNPKLKKQVLDILQE